VREGSTFEYSATFGQAIDTAPDSELLVEYSRAIIFDYSYRYFHRDGYSKEYRVLNLREDRDEHGQPTGRPLLYLVRETKGTHDRDKWLPDERRKVVCGERHFRHALGVDYEVVVATDELP
jgi:hypothetical protein